MKKAGKFLTAVATGALSVAMVMGSTGTAALAASERVTVTGKDYALTAGLNESTVEYGEKFTVPTQTGYEVKIYNPKGADCTPTTSGASYEVTADTLGHYTVVYTKEGENGAKYSYSVFCSVADEYNIEVDASSIPSYVAKGATVKFPEAKVYTVNEDGDKVYLDGTVSPVVTAIDGVETVAANEYKFTKAGAAYVTYTHEVGAGVYATKEYVVNVQTDFKDETKPTLSLASYSSTSSLNVKYSLPKATASDAYDERVKVIITVTDPEGNPVKECSVNQHGYGYVEEGKAYAELAFNNDDVMAFYPTVKGDYKVTYKAVDDSGNEAKSLSYVLTVKDQKGPTINVDRATIPETWGFSKVYYKDADGNEVAKTEDATAITFPVPTYYDNNDKSELVVTLRVKDPEGNEAVKVSNIQNKGKTVTDKSFTISNTAVATELNDGNLISFNVFAYINEIKAKIEAGTEDGDYKYSGVYTAQYTVEDPETGSTTSTQTYSINVSESYYDDSEVAITAPATIEKNHILSEGDSFTLPTFTLSSANDGYLTKTYTIKAGETAMGYNKFVGGETIELVQKNGGYVLSYEDAEDAVYELAVENGTVITYVLSATADSGVTKTDASKSSTIVIPETNARDYTVTANEELTEVTVDLGESDNQFVGIEAGLRNAKDEYVSFEATLYYNPNTNQKVLTDIVFPTPTESGDYFFEVRVYDIYGSSQVNVYTVTLNATEENDDRETVPSAFADSVSVGNSVTWFSKTFATGGAFGSDVDVIATAHKVVGGRFTAMADKFTPLTETTYTITDMPLPLDAAGAVVAGYEDKVSIFATTNTVKAVASTAQTLVLDKPMPSYLALGAEATEIPEAVIYGASKNFAYTMSVTDPNGSSRNYDNYVQFAEECAFNADGKYTIAYLVNGSTVKSYTVKVGDNTAPEFTVSAPTKEVKKGYEFTFAKVALATDEASEISKYTFKKSVKDASGELVGTEVSGKGSTYADRAGSKIKLDKSGVYTVTYQVIDENGNTSTQKFEIKVTTPTTVDPIDYKVLSTILIVVAVIIIVGVVVYLFVGGKGNKKKSK